MSQETFLVNTPASLIGQCRCVSYCYWLTLAVASSSPLLEVCETEYERAVYCHGVLGDAIESRPLRNVHGRLQLL